MNFNELIDTTDLSDIEDDGIRLVVQALKTSGNTEDAEMVALYARDAQHRIQKLYSMICEMEENVQEEMHGITSGARLVWAGVDDE